MKERKQIKECKGWKRSWFRKSNIPALHKKSKNKDTIEPNLTIIIKAARIERQRVKMLKQQLF